MKKIIIAVSSALALILMSSCTKEFVTVKHNYSEPQSEYYINESRMYEGLVAAYDPLKWYDYFYGYCDFQMLSDFMADDVYRGGDNEGDGPEIVKIHYYTATPTEIATVPWTTSYSGINRCCHVLENVDGVPGMSEETKTLYKAEATVLKAFYYTILWKFWGNIPYYDENLTSPYVAPQLKADEVYEKIVARLEEAIGMDVLPMKQTPDNYGRVTKAMAYMLYAEVVMYQKDESRYPQALAYMKEIIESNQYSLVDDFGSIWDETGEWGNESIWEINYISEGGVRDWGAPIATGGNVYARLIGIQGGVSGVYDDGWGWSPVTPAAWEQYGAEDTRKAGIYDHHTVGPDLGVAGKRWQATGYFLHKYMARTNYNHGCKADEKMNYGNNKRVYRYAETLLNAAELAGAAGNQYIDLLRSTRHSDGTGYTIDDILAERRKEFVGEGKRYWDLVRTGKAAEVLTAVNRSFDGSNPIDWSENKKYWPIPQSEIDKTANTEYPLQQNNY